MKLEIQQLSKCYSNGVQALSQVSLTCPKGIYGLLGQNGAGKSTLMRTIATLQDADEGEIFLDEVNLQKFPKEARSMIGYLPQDMGVYPNMSALETLEYFAGLKGLHRVNLHEELERVNLVNEAHQRLDTYSGGMRRRFGIAVAFLGQPRLVIVDEPTAGLDPFERRRFQHLLATAAQNCILILSSHIVEDISDLASNMAILHKGKVLAEGPPSELVSKLEGKIHLTEVPFEHYEEAHREHQVLSSRPKKNSHLLRIYSKEALGGDFTMVPPDLEDFYAFRVGEESQKSDLVKS
ncbi:MAG: multidrug ABC transporter ATP-binding protein [Verrucomicrobiales bacterium]|nr:multidrug ABC transporter ATP-binding protein [Verrucomicrobiales bacterium]|tara:strand:- start:7544 stop:8425 length:882 start_codon:yes stop_codon:yes gene_type:complete